MLSDNKRESGAPLRIPLALDLLELGYTFPSITDETGQDGKLIGQPQVAAKLPFLFRFSPSATPTTLRAIFPPSSTPAPRATPTCIFRVRNNSQGVKENTSVLDT